MNALVLAAGYGTRLTKGIAEDTTGHFSHLLGLPKPLVPVGGTPLINRWLDAFAGCTHISRVFVVCNAHNYPQFKRWADTCSFPLDNIINDGTLSNKTRRVIGWSLTDLEGAIGDIHLVIRDKKLEGQRLLVVAGDTLFEKTFSLNVPDLVNTFVRESDDKDLFLTYYMLLDHAEVAKRGILELSESSRRNGSRLVTSFLEKPHPDSTSSSCACPPLYLYSKEALAILCSYVAEFSSERDRLDAPGKFIEWAHERIPVFGVEIPGRFDIGNLHDYIETDRYFTSEEES